MDIDISIRSVPIHIKADGFKNKNLFRKELNEYDKKLIVMIIKDCLNKNIIGESPAATEIINTLLNLFKSEENADYDDVYKTLKAENNDALLAYLMLAFKNFDCNITLLLYYVYGKISPMNTKKEWLDNFRIKALMHIISLSKFKKDDSQYTYSIAAEKCLPINRSISLDFSRIIRFVIGDLKKFIIVHQIYPFYSIDKKENSKNNISLTDEEICDRCYEYFPFFSGDCHGCDAFYINFTLTISEIDLFLQRYPSAVLGYILNTATYASGKGEHWLAVIFTKHQATMLCSQGSDFSVFKDNGRLRADIERHKFGMSYSSRVIQHDSYNCGLYSVLSLIMYLNNYDIGKSIEGAIKAAIDLIGADGEQLNNGDIDKFRENLLGVK
jgi:hypothetical protein